MLLVALPMRNTEYSNNCTAPVRAPTIRSVPDTDCEKFSRTSCRTRSTVSNRKVDRAIDGTTSDRPKRRCQALCHATLSSAFTRSLRAAHCGARAWGGAAGSRQDLTRSHAIDGGQLHHAAEVRRQTAIVADEKQRGSSTLSSTLR